MQNGKTEQSTSLLRSSFRGPEEVGGLVGAAAAPCLPRQRQGLRLLLKPSMGSHQGGELRSLLTLPHPVLPVLSALVTAF